MEYQLEPDARSHFGQNSGVSLNDVAQVSLAISMKRLADVAEHQAISMKRLADHFCPPLEQETMQ